MIVSIEGLPNDIVHAVFSQYLLPKAAEKRRGARATYCTGIQYDVMLYNMAYYSIVYYNILQYDMI